ncbi:hypothetical protein K7432_015990 [Basidiobolus ranarum]|uniref:C2H2-type domain-containing protein n=1 Tax=Basidiobolus ranarum TaxID=34480 RepID=A0ABR2WFE5_9FUNG
MSEIADPGDIADIINEFLDTESSEGTLEKEDADSDYTPSSSRRSSISSFGPEEVTNSCLVKDRTCDGNIRCSTSKKQIKNSPRRTSRKKSIVENVDIKEPEEGDHDKTVTVYSCDFPSCGKTFTRLYNLKSHYRTHTDDRPFACDKCDQTFSRNHDLKRHYKIHSGVKPFNCEHCGKKFSRMDALGRHRAKRPQCRE